MAIIMAAHVLDSEAPPQLIKSARDQILKSSRRIDTMVKDLLDFTYVRLKGHLVIRPAAMDLQDFMQSLLEEIGNAYPKVKINVSLQGDTRGEWDESRLGQMMSNLIINAVQHRSAGTPVKVTVKGTGERVLLSVHNQGPPIAADRLPEIFDPLERAVPIDSQQTSRPSHLGIGLFIAQVIARSHGGNISVISSEAQGTRFDVLLPRRPRKSPASSRERREAVPRQGWGAVTTALRAPGERVLQKGSRADPAVKRKRPREILGPFREHWRRERPPYWSLRWFHTDSLVGDFTRVNLL